jgi:hypothetical protein
MEDVRPKLADIERDHILATLALCEGNRTRTANILGISVRCLRNRLHKYAGNGFGVPQPKTGVVTEPRLDSTKKKALTLLMC